MKKEHHFLPLVSVVIPTRYRPEMVCRSVLSALRQTHPNLEVIVVVDGPDPLTIAALGALDDPRLRTVPLPENVGGSDARNCGVRTSKGEWIAFLDDDDEWLPQKLEKQLALALEMSTPIAFVACRFLDRDRFGERVLPPMACDPTMPFSEFLLCRPGLTGGSGYVQTSTWLVSRRLAQQCPFTPGLKRNQDLDWMLRAMAVPGACFALVSEALSIFNSSSDPRRVSKISDWEFHYNWALTNRRYFTPKALTYFLSIVCVEDAVKQGRRLSASRQLIVAIVLNGKPSVKSWLFFLYYMFIPEQPRQRLRLALAALKRGHDTL